MSDGAEVTFKAWGIECSDCGLLEDFYVTRQEARDRAKKHRGWYQKPLPTVRAVPVVVTIREAQR